MCQGQTLEQALVYLKDGHEISRLDYDGHLEGVKLKDGTLLIIRVGEDEETGDKVHDVWEPTQSDVLATDWNVT